jgi:hypothetical protein
MTMTSRTSGSSSITRIVHDSLGGNGLFSGVPAPGISAAAERLQGSDIKTPPLPQNPVFIPAILQEIEANIMPEF